MPRVKIYEKLWTRVTPDQKRFIEKTSEKTGKKQGQIVRDILQDHINRVKDKK